MSIPEPDLAAYFAGVIDNGGYVSLIETRGKPMPSVSFVTYYEGLAVAAMDFFGCGHITEKKVANERINRQGVPIDIRYRWCASWADAVKVAKIIAPHLAYYREIALKVSEPAQA